MEVKQRTVRVPLSAVYVTFISNKDGTRRTTYIPGLTRPSYTDLDERYTPNSKGYGPRTSWKPFQHYKCCAGPLNTSAKVSLRSDWGISDWPIHQAVSEPVGPEYCYLLQYPYSSSEPFGDMGKCNSDLPLFVQQPDPGGNIIPLYTGHSVMLHNLTKAMLPLIKAELSLPNSIYELKDFRRPVMNVVNFFRRKYYKHLLKRVRFIAGRKKSLSSWIKGAAGLYLEYKFNLAPLVSDICGIHTAMSRTADRIADLLARESIPQRKHKSCSFKEFPDVADQESNTGGYFPSGSGGGSVGDAHRIMRSVHYEDSVFHAEIQYNYNYTEFQRVFAQLLGHLDALGVNLNPAIIWNAIPWSFVVDWTLGISKWLDDYKAENMRPTINIHRSCWSISRKRTITIVNKQWCPPWNCPYATTIRSVNETAYRRDINYVDSSLITSSGLNLQEVSLGAALVIANTKHHSTRGYRAV